MVQNRYIRLPLLCLPHLTERFAWDGLRRILPGCRQMANVRNGIETCRKFQSSARTLQTTDGRATTYSRENGKNVNSRFKAPSGGL